MSFSLVFIAIILGPLLYIAVTLTGKKPTDYDDFHYGGRTIPVNQYTDSTVMYAVQVAAITLFATWGFEFGFWTILVPIFWGMGYFIISFMLDKGLLDNFLKQQKIGTIHQFLSEKGNLKTLGSLAAFASLLGIAGPAMYEAEFVGELAVRVSTASLESDLANPIVNEYSILFFGSFLIIASIYMLYGGFKAIVRTDVYQLGIGYIGFSVVLSIMLMLIANSGYKLASLVFLFILTLSSGILLFYWKRVFKIQEGTEKLLLSETPLYFGFGSYLVGLFIVLFLIQANDNAFSSSHWNDFIDTHKMLNPFSLGFITIVSLLIANSLYQIVDIGQWQRLASVKLNQEDYHKSRNNLSKAIKVTGVYTAFTWIVAVFFGMALKYINAGIVENPYDAVALFLIDFSQGDIIEQSVVFIMILSLVAIMFSTLDSLVSSITFTIHNDWLVTVNEKFRTITVGRVFTVLFLIITFYLYGILSDRVNSFADILYSCWSFQIALFPLVVLAVWKKSIPGFWSLLSLIGGMYGALIPLIHTKLNISPYEFSPILALIISTSIMTFGYLINKLRDKSARN